ncbi:universal stress protein [Mesonia sp. K7]|uniref:universal stress protein n=1 Tax=Mesonia sp. K7 TaxID=2218606 RepID=UPI000DA8F934|nr:universal stress protein [Mesonia sp. K7]PZD78781.1 universal stress protein [Mesonia sp. K7]
MKKILVPTDFSKQAEDALKVAAQLARKYDSEIYLTHLLDLPADTINPVAGGNGNNLPESIFFMKLAHQKFEKMMALDFLEGIKVHETVQFNKTFEGIMDFIKENKVDLIVMGSHGVSGMKEIFIGSNTEKVVRHAEVPVLVVKHDFEINGINSMIYATDLLEDKRHSFLKALNFARKMDAMMHVVYINTSNKFKTTDYIDEKTEKFFSGVTYDKYDFELYNAKSVEEGILKFASRKNAGLIGISTHGRKGLAHFLNGSLSEDLANHAKRPVVTFKI